MKQIKNKNCAMKKVESQRGADIEELLRIKFVEENKQVVIIAKELNISYATVIKWLKQAGIYSRKLKTISNQKEE